MTSKNSRRCKGFSLLELLVSTIVLVTVLGTAFSAMNGFSKSYGSTMQKADMDSGGRSAAELLTQEIEQAGSLPSVPVQFTAAVASNINAQTVNVTSTVGMYVGQKLFVDAGGSPETVIVQSVASPTSVTAVFGASHPAGAPVDTSGMFSQGILSASTPNQLMLVGDMNGDGTLVYVEYDCNPNANGTGTLTRSFTQLPAAGKNPGTVLLQNLITNPGPLGNSCFTIPAATAAAGFNFITSVGVTLTTQSSAPDPQSGAFQTLTTSLMNLSPRNVLLGLVLAQTSATTRLQPTPPGLPLS